MLKTGEIVDLSPTMYLAINKLEQAIECVANGQTSAISLIEFDGRRERSLCATIDGEGIQRFGEILAMQSAGVLRYGSLWDGNAPATARSFREQ